MTTTRVHAAVDVGSTSVHLLVAAVEPGGLVPLVDQSAFLGLAAIVDAGGVLGATAIDEVVRTLEAFGRVARGAGAGSFTVAGTEPLRRAGDAARAVRAAEAAGFDLNVVDHREEALLVLIGATGGTRLEHEAAIADVGGGSTEIVTTGPDAAPVVAGFRLGAARLTARFVAHDPATPAEIEAMDVAARSAFARRPGDRAVPHELVVVGGTAENVHRLVQGRRGGGPLDRDDLARARGLLAAAPGDVVAASTGIRPARVRLLAAGTAILGALLDRFGAASLRVSPAGLREGAVLAADCAGSAWRDALPELARGWRPPDPGAGGTPGSPPVATVAPPSA